MAMSTLKSFENVTVKAATIGQSAQLLGGCHVVLKRCRLRVPLKRERRERSESPEVVCIFEGTKGSERGDREEDDEDEEEHEEGINVRKANFKCRSCNDSLFQRAAEWRKLRSSRMKIKMREEVARANVVVTQCGHLFHRRCLINHLKSREGMLPPPHKLRNCGLCPTCNRKVFIQKVHPVHLSVLKKDDGNCVYCDRDLQGAHGGPMLNYRTRAEFPHLAGSEICCTPCGHLSHKVCYLKHLTDRSVGSNKRNTGQCESCSAKVWILKTYPVFFQ